jgi:uncharacterized protein (TIGR01777 family)
MRILITGGTGYLGQKLTEHLLRDGHEVIVATRQKNSDTFPYPIKFTNYPLSDAFCKTDLNSIDACIHLAGESINGRWTNTKKKKILSSRADDTKTLVENLKHSTSLKVFLSASAIGIYGDRFNEELFETSPSGEGFLADVCKAWEHEALKLSHVRTVLLRTGIVLSRGHGALSELESLFKNYLGSAQGTGQQYMSWIHVDDWVRAVDFCLKTMTISGPMNLVAPAPVTNKEFSEVLCKLHGYSPMPRVPSFVLKTILGEMAELILCSQRVSAKKLVGAGFKFQFTALKACLEDLYGLNAGGNPFDDVLTTTQFVPRELKETFEFFKNEKNLEMLTPEFLNFQVVGKSTANIQSGTLIDYKLRIHGVPVRWRTEIKDWNPPHKFTDTQLKGPYSKWYHTHTFESFCNGTLMKDRVFYRLPFGILGRIFGKPIVKKDVSTIFNYRRKKIKEIFK